MAIGYKEQSAASVPTPAVGEQYTFIDTADGKVKRKDSSGTVTVIETAGGLSASSVSNTPAGNIVATNVQAAINELDAEKAPLTHVGAGGPGEHPIATGSVAGFMSPSDFTKLGTVASGATANDTDANLKARANHTGTQTASTISDFNTAADARVTAGLATHTGASDPHPGYALDADVTAAQAFAVARANHTGTQTASTISDFSTAADARITAQKGVASGLATLDGSSKIPTSQLPALAITDTFVVNSQALMLALTAETGDIAVRTDLNKSFILAGSNPTVLGDWQELLTPTDSVTSVNGQTGTVVLTKTDVGLGNVDNTSDANKPVSTATQTALNLKADINNPTFTGTVSGVTKAMVGLSNIDNTSDVNKPVSTAQAAADTAVQSFATQRVNHTGTQASSTITNFTSDVQGAAVQNALTPSSSVKAPSVDATVSGLALKADKAGDTFTGPIVAKGDNAGTGYVNYEAQTSPPSTPSTGFRQFADSSGRFSWKGTNGFTRTINATGITADRVYSLPDASLTLMGDPQTTAGDMIYRNASNVNTRLPIGSSDQILRVMSGIPSWQSENLTQDFGDASDGNLTVSGALTLSQIMYYDTLTIAAGAVINPAGYPIYCKTLDLTNAPAGAIVRNGNNGASVVGNTGGAAGTALAGAILGGSLAGTAGANGATNAGASSATPAGASPSNGGAGGNSGASGAGGTGAAAASGGGGTATNYTHLGRFEYQFLRGATQIVGGAGGDGGNSGGGDGANSSRGAGGGGSGGGVIVIYAANIITSGSTASGVIQARGGSGGTGAAAPLGNVGGCGGAGGGGGGFIYLTYVTKTGPAVTNLIDCNAGNGSNAGNGIGTGIGGNGGNGGNGGVIQTYNVTTGVGVQVLGTTGAAGTAGSGITGGTGGNGGVCQLTL